MIYASPLSWTYVVHACDSRPLERGYLWESRSYLHDGTSEEDGLSRLEFPYLRPVLTEAVVLPTLPTLTRLSSNLDREPTTGPRRWHQHVFPNPIPRLSKCSCLCSQWRRSQRVKCSCTLTQLPSFCPSTSSGSQLHGRQHIHVDSHIQRCRSAEVQRESQSLPSPRSRAILSCTGVFDDGLALALQLAYRRPLTLSRNIAHSEGGHETLCQLKAASLVLRSHSSFTTHHPLKLIFYQQRAPHQSSKANNRTVEQKVKLPIHYHQRESSVMPMIGSEYDQPLAMQEADMAAAEHRMGPPGDPTRFQDQLAGFMTPPGPASRPVSGTFDPGVDGGPTTPTLFSDHTVQGLADERDIDLPQRHIYEDEFLGQRKGDNYGEEMPGVWTDDYSQRPSLLGEPLPGGMAPTARETMPKTYHGSSLERTFPGHNESMPEGTVG